MAVRRIIGIKETKPWHSCAVKPKFSQELPTVIDVALSVNSLAGRFVATEALIVLLVFQWRRKQLEHVIALYRTIHLPTFHTMSYKAEMLATNIGHCHTMLADGNMMEWMKESGSQLKGL